MVSFTCNFCQDVVKKPKVVSHANSCGGDSFTCVDCMQVFDRYTIVGHISCISEVDKYQGQWKRKCTASGNPREGRFDAAPPLRPPRPSMDDLSDSDDDDWVTSKKKPTSKVCKASGLNTGMSVPPAKRPRNEHPPVRSTAASEDTDTKASSSSQATKTYPHDSASPCKVASHVTPLSLPHSATSADCVVPSFTLGRSEDIAEIVKEVFVESGVASMNIKDVAKHLVTRYRTRIAKSLRHAVATAVELGALEKDSDGNLSIV